MHILINYFSAHRIITSVNQYLMSNIPCPPPPAIQPIIILHAFGVFGAPQLHSVTQIRQKSKTDINYWSKSRSA